MIAKGFRAGAAICLWVIQHVLDPKDVIGRIVRVLKPGGFLYTLNGQTRCLPTDAGWVSDGVDVRGDYVPSFKKNIIKSCLKA